MKVRVAYSKFKDSLEAQLKSVRKFGRKAKSLENKTHWLKQERELAEAIRQLDKFKSNVKKFKSWVFLNNRMV